MCIIISWNFHCNSSLMMNLFMETRACRTCMTTSCQKGGDLRLVRMFLNLLLFLSIYKIGNTVAFPLQKSIVQIGQRVFAIKTGPSRFLDGKIGPSRFLLSSSDLDCIWHDLQVILATHRISPPHPVPIKGHGDWAKYNHTSHKPIYFYLSFTLISFNLHVIHLLIRWLRMAL